jgi:pimeloyl-ACP methyl ester carboxylesterase
MMRPSYVSGAKEAAVTATTTIDHRVVRANGITFEVAVSGDEGAPAVLCLHGFPEGWMSWRGVMQRLDGYRIYAPTLRGYPGSDRPRRGYDVLTLTEDVRGLIYALGLERPPLVTHDWGGAMGWIFAHRYSPLISQLVVVNCTHPRTLVRAAVRFQHLQPLRIPWVLPFQIPRLPEALISSKLGRRLLEWTFTVREGRPGTMDRATVAEMVERFQRPEDAYGPIEYYRAFFQTLVLPARRRQLYSWYETPITVPVTLVWGTKDGALPAPIAITSYRDAGCPVDWRPLPGVGHFVDLEAADELVTELRRVLKP